MTRNYVHGYDAREGVRLIDQATTLAEILHFDSIYPAGSAILEAGCGVGAQTVILARRNPKARITSIDISDESLSAARKRVSGEGFTNVSFSKGDIFHLPYPEESFDHVFVCFVLEHVPNPIDALTGLRRVLKRGGTITAIEGDHGSAYFHPDSEAAKRAIRCQVDLQARMGGNSLIGRELYPLLKSAGYHDVSVSPRTVYVDSSKPEFVEGFTKNTFIAMIEGIKAQAIGAAIIDEPEFDKGINDLYRTTEEDGTFIYTFFKGRAYK
ncbi:MAG: methyltransferase domain-containing protein [bacterium]|jgi:SAM-dependent methyltransferase